jgi:hypothetical protein
MHNELCPWCCVFVEKLVIAQLFKIFFYRTRMLLPWSSKLVYRALSWARWISLAAWHLISLRSVVNINLPYRSRMIFNISEVNKYSGREGEVDHCLLSRCCGSDSDRSSGFIYLCCTVCPEHTQARHKVVGNIGSKTGLHCNDTTNCADPAFSVRGSLYTAPQTTEWDCWKTKGQLPNADLEIRNQPFFFNRKRQCFSTLTHIYIHRYS